MMKEDAFRLGAVQHRHQGACRRYQPLTPEPDPTPGHRALTRSTPASLSLVHPPMLSRPDVVVHVHPGGSLPLHAQHLIQHPPLDTGHLPVKLPHARRLLRQHLVYNIKG